MGIELIHVDAGERFFERLAGVTEPEEKRKIIGELFVRIFEENTGGLTDADVPRAGHALPGRDRERDRRTPRSSRAITTSAACPRT